MKVLVTGGAGYIGSVVVEECLNSGLHPVVIDTLEKGHSSAVPKGVPLIVGDISERGLLREIFRRFDIDAVIHLAAYSLVGESVKFPKKYYRNNLESGLVLLEAMAESKVNKIVFSSTAAVYGEPAKQPIEEDDPTDPTNPYGETKLLFEKALEMFHERNGLQHISLRYFNAAGATYEHGECHDPETHLIPLALRAAAGAMESIDVFGTGYPTRDGTCVRDYIHVIDLAKAHILALNSSSSSSVYNLGCGGMGYSVKEVLTAVEEVTGRPIRRRIASRREGDPATLIASSDRIRQELGWKPQHQDLHRIIDSAWSLMLRKRSYELVGG